MTDRIKESLSLSLSAWADGEASEIEVHQLLRQYGADESVMQDWVGFQHARATLRQDSPLSLGQHLALHSSIRAAIATDEPAHGDDLNRSTNAQRRPIAVWAKPAGGLAIAASLMVAVLLGVQQQAPSSSEVASNAASPIISHTGPVTVQTVGAGKLSGQSARPSVEEPMNDVGNGDAGLLAAQGDSAYETIDGQLELKALDVNKQRQLRAYLREHDQMVRMNPNTRTVMFESSKGGGQ
ncbi:MAG: RseA family anti-sigma factor [SAR86 cluster bacterium]|uniref:Anti sigma-E protein RseA N-terminal domain-containing protein n=1 Tax=SAR86 cluster bacterium TaxID=2030880 RepID=A0A973AB17_9GAMM|nr:hypothetical protein [SAR86 cluster bacterium]